MKIKPQFNKQEQDTFTGLRLTSEDQNEANILKALMEGGGEADDMTVNGDVVSIVIRTRKEIRNAPITHSD